MFNQSTPPPPYGHYVSHLYYHHQLYTKISPWHGNFGPTVYSPLVFHEWPAMRYIDVFFDIGLHKLLNKQPNAQPSSDLRRHAANMTSL